MAAGRVGAWLATSHGRNAVQRLGSRVHHSVGTPTTFATLVARQLYAVIFWAPPARCVQDRRWVPGACGSDPASTRDGHPTATAGTRSGHSRPSVSKSAMLAN